MNIAEEKKQTEQKPEEEVRQKYICRLVNDYGYNLQQMEQELQVTNSQRSTGAARASQIELTMCAIMHGEPIHSDM